MNTLQGRLAGKKAIVTGGARGIGASISERLVSEGAEVTILDRLGDRGHDLAEDLGARFAQVDLEHTDQTAAVMEQVIADLGGVDILVNNAGILEFASLLETDVADWNRAFAINTTAMLVTMQAAASSMIAAGSGGSIINIASMAGKSGGSGQVAYAASKAAVIALTRVSALELGVHNIRANSLCPGYVLTEMGADTRTQEEVELWSSYSPLGRLGTPEDVAGMATFLATADAEYLTGQAFNVTGGMIMY